ncbi:Hsp70 family protein [Lentzea sp. NPDC003310]|uniref:Hsp70 family protein n=1 Tax=Lentzea sp. NPDC003310 TaxID=3154447 RepID=UPI0033BF10FA
MNTKAFGIDLGTTHSVLAHLDHSGKPVVVRNAVDEEITPTAVYFEAPLEVMIGGAAKNSAVLEPRNYCELVKRHMGSPGVRYPHHGHSYSPVEISALVLRYLAECGRRATGVAVEDVVITVPAHFGIAEREATRAAGEIAGLTVRDVIVEPVAAALHYGLGRADAGVRHVLVCDLGGGTCDTTVIRFEGDLVQVVCTGGDGALGGADWDARVRDHLVDEFVRQHPRTDPTADDVFMNDVVQRAELLKKELSSAQTRHTELRFRGAVARVELTRATLDELTADLVGRVVDLTRRTVEEAARKGVREFDDVLLVGGMTKSPAIAAALRAELGLDPRSHEPHLAVAKGAAIFAAQRQVRIREERRAAGISADKAATTAAVVPRSVGVKALDPSDPMVEVDVRKARFIVQHLLIAGETLPAKSDTYQFAVVFAKARMAEIEVWEQNPGEDSMDLSTNRVVGKGFLRDMPPKPKGAVILVWFAMSATGELSVHASDPDSSAQVRFDLRIDGLTEPDVSRSRDWITRHRLRD